MIKKCIVIQDGINECGSACLLSIIRYYGGNMPIFRLLDLTRTGKEGTNFYYLKEAANYIGLSAKAYQIDDIATLRNTRMPFISQVIINGCRHFVVVYKIHKKMITIMDPAKGMVTLNLDDFKNIWTSYILVLEPYKKLPVYEDNKYVLKKISEICIENIPLIVGIILFTLITTILTCIYAYYFKYIIDSYDKTSLNMMVIFISVLSIKCLIEYLRNNLLMHLNRKIDLAIISTTIKKIITLPYSYYKERTTGEMVTRVNDLMYVKNVVTKVITVIVLDILLSILVLVILFLINIKMTLILLMITIIYLLVFTIYKNQIKKTTGDIQERSAKTNSLLVEAISGYNSVKGLNMEDTFIHKIKSSYKDLIGSNFTLNKIDNTSNFIKDLAEGIFIILIIYLGMTLVMNNKLSLGSLLTYYTLLFYFLNPIRNILDFYKEFYYVGNSIRRINNLMSYKCDELDNSSSLLVTGDIHINNLCFSYDGRSNILNNITLDIDEGKKVLLLGESGSGKSTLLKLIYRYYDIEKNKIFIGKNDLLDYKLSDIRGNISYLSQEEFLYTDTIKNNIILDRDFTYDEFLKVCELTNVDDFIKDNPMEYDMPLLENGVNLSGGQRQRIILARTLLKKAKIILIDEGTNEIDINLERRILKNIFDVYKNTTIIIVSHRNDNMDLFDKVIMLNDGNIIKNLERRNNGINL